MNSLRHLLLLIAALASALTASAVPAAEAVEVEVLVFSGRRNPVFTITDPAEIRELFRSAKALPRAAKVADQAAPALGYRGIIVRNRSSFDPDVQTLQVHRSKIAVGRAATIGEQAVHHDPGAALEQRLLKLALKHGALPPGLLAHIQPPAQ